jgi:hypothetical protein
VSRTPGPWRVSAAGRGVLWLRRKLSACQPKAGELRSLSAYVPLRNSVGEVAISPTSSSAWIAINATCMLIQCYRFHRA